MKKDFLLSKLREYGLHSKEAYMAEAFSRNIGFLTQAEQDELANAKVAIAGMGGVGGVHLITMVRTGIGRFHLADFDTFEPANVNRQYGARIPEFGRPKLEVMFEEAIRINPFLEIKQFPEGITTANVDEFLEGVQVVLDGLDFFNLDTRRILFKRAREKGVYIVVAGPLGFSSAMIIFSPHEGMGFEEYLNLVEGMSPQDQYLAFGLGLAPGGTHTKYMDFSRVDLESKAGPSLGIACQICSAMAATEAIRIILKKGRVKPVPHFFQFDPYVPKYRKGKMYLGNRNPIQQVKMAIVKMILRRNKEKYKPSPPELPAQVGTDVQPSDQVIRFIIRAGIQAPSGDNVQPWRFSYQGNTICLYLNREADTSFFNINQLASIISCGAVLENIRIAAGRFGLEARVIYLPALGEDDLMARVELSPIETATDPLFKVIWKRQTNRKFYKFYKRETLPSSVLQGLRECISGFPTVRLHFITEKSDLKKTAGMIYQADRIRSEHRPLHEHFGKMVRFSNQEARETRDGLPVKTLEVGLSGEIFLKATRPWWVMNLANKIGLGKLVAGYSYLWIRSASAVALLTVAGLKTEDFLLGGQALERVWLTLTHKGIAMQPMTAITLFWLRWQLEGEESFSQKHRQLLRDVWEEYRTLFPEVDFSKDGHVMLFRFGQGKEMKYGTYRKDVESLLV